MIYTSRFQTLLFLSLSLMTSSSAAAVVDEHSCDPSIGSFAPVYDLGPGQPATRLLKTVEFAIKASAERALPCMFPFLISSFPVFPGVSLALASLIFIAYRYTVSQRDQGGLQDGSPACPRPRQLLSGVLRVHRHRPGPCCQSKQQHQGQLSCGPSIFHAACMIPISQGTVFMHVCIASILYCTVHVPVGIYGMCGIYLSQRVPPPNSLMYGSRLLIASASSTTAARWPSTPA